MTNTATVLPQTSKTVWNIDPAHSIAEFKDGYARTSIKGYTGALRSFFRYGSVRRANRRPAAWTDSLAAEARFFPLVSFP